MGELQKSKRREENIMFCKKCGKKIETGWVKCPYCGTVVESTRVDSTVNMDSIKTDKNENMEYASPKDKADQQYMNHSCAMNERVINSRKKIQHRSFWKFLLLSIVTFGIYGIYAFYGFVKDINKICQDDGKESPNYIIVLLLSVVTCGIYGIYWWYRQGERIKEAASGYGVEIRENGTTILVWVILGYTIMPVIGVFVATYIMFDNVNRIALGYNQEVPVEELGTLGKLHPHLVRNSLIIWMGCMFSAFVFLVVLASFGGKVSTEDKIATESITEKKPIKPEKGNTELLKDIDISDYKNKSINELKKVITDLENDGNLYYNSDKTIFLTIDSDENINAITIKGNPKIAPYFAQVHLEDKVEEVDKNIKDEYQIIKTETAVIDTKGNTLREYREKSTTNKFFVIYEGKSKKVTEINWVFNGVDFIFPDSSEKLIEDKETLDLTDTEKQLAINEIFARHGRRFNSVDIQNYFDSKEWYNGNIAPEDFDEMVFNSVEKDNILRLSGKSNAEQEEQSAVENEEVINGYIHINASIQAILKSPEKYIGEKVCFDGIIQKSFNGILELSYFQGGEQEIQVSAYYDKSKLNVMPENQVLDASTIVWGIVSGANEQAGVEIQLESIYIGTNNIYFSQNANEYHQVPTFRELNYSDNFDLGEKLILEGTLQYDDNNIDYKLVMDTGRCLLSSSMKAFADMSIYEVTSMDSFVDKRVRVYGLYGSMAPLIAVEYIEPLE